MFAPRRHLRNLLTTSLAATLFLMCAVAAFAQGQPAPRPVKFDSATISGLSARNIGSATMSARILIDPADGNTVYACATGHIWDDSTERGVYKTTDGGKTWRKVLAGANPSSGCAMLSMNAQEPKTLYAAMWDFRRQGWTFRSGGPGSGLFKSTDGGENWTELDKTNSQGLP